MKVLELAWKRSKRTSFQTATDFVMAVRLRRIILNEKHELVDHYLQLRKTTMEGVPAVVEPDKGPALAYGGVDNDLSAEKKIFLGHLHEQAGKPTAPQGDVDPEHKPPAVDESDDYFFMPDLADEEDEDE